MSFAYPIIFNLIEALSALVVGTSAVKGVVDSAKALRSKGLAKRYLQSKGDRRLLYLAKIASKRALKYDEVQVARERIRDLLEEMPPRQAAIVERGISQASKSGERRFIEEMITPESNC
ncbi:MULTISPECIES: hypothetical protein [unclassified Rhizobium]|uniref:hypothetical protein n=1 Tax=unclassified Rhizobium TaxID=2613769 RepID=UPI0010524025|nr:MULTISPECIES: hypothetical protein [unclassified Rhizobium]MBB3394188.1 hypothetical protein [Rhizobium sp. BK060]TCM63357.1 hypothetical protein EV291_14915 [Rhizobium sp. BK068]